MFREYMEGKGMGVNRSPSEVKESGSKLLGEFNPVDPYARPLEESGETPKTFEGSNNSYPEVTPQDTVKNQLDPSIDVDRPGPQTGTGGEIPRN